MHAVDLPLLALTMGDAAGVGPEVIAGAWGDPRIHAAGRPLVLGHPEILRRAAELRQARLTIRTLQSVDELAGLPGDPLRSTACR